jgi:hypothetical protein
LGVKIIPSAIITIVKMSQSIGDFAEGIAEDLKGVENKTPGQLN